MCINCTYGDGKPVTCCKCEGPLRGGFCLFCDLKDSFTNAYSFNDTSSNFNHLPHPQYENYLCKLCGNNSHDGYDCQQQFLFVYEQEPSYNQNYNECINSPSWNRPTFFNDNEEHSVQYKEYLENYSNEIAASNSNQEKEKPPQDSDIHQLIREECCIEVCKKQKQNTKDMMLELIEVCRQKEFYCMHDNVDDLIESALNSKLLSINLESQRLDKKKQEVKNIVEQPTKRRTRIVKSLHNFRVVHKKSFISLNNTSLISLGHAITLVLPIEKPEYSLSMRYKHLSTIIETESDKVTESSVKNLLPILSEYEVTSDDESECDVPDKDDSSPVFTTFSNPLFNDNDDFTSSDDESLPDEDVPTEEFKVYSNPLFDDEEINSDKLDPHCFYAESDFVESLLNRYTLIDSSPKFDFLLKEFSGELTHINPILPGIKESDFNLEEEIYFVENLLYDNSSPRPPEELNSEIADTIVESVSPSTIPVDDSDSLMDEIDLFLAMDELLPPDIESDGYDSEWDIYFLEELLSDDSISLLENESFYFDHQNDPSFPRPPLEPLDAEFYFDFEPNSGELISAVINNIEEINKDECFDQEVSPLLLSAESEDTIFDPGISV
nr:hypothetical protein [Tanacetum cinerariifolium]